MLESIDEFNINPYTGAVGYFYPLEVSSGTNGLEPELSIFYNSYNAVGSPGILGSGWGFSQSYIEGFGGDKFRLILEGSSYDLVNGSDENRYHTKIESFLHIENKSGGNNTYTFTKKIVFEFKNYFFVFF